MNYIYKLEIFPAGCRLPNENVVRVKAADLKLVSKLAATSCGHLSRRYSLPVCVYFSTRHNDAKISAMWKFGVDEDKPAKRIRAMIQQAIADSPYGR